MRRVEGAVETQDVGVSPAAASYITGFSLVADATSVFAISSQVVGQIFAADYARPTPSNLTTAIADMELAFTNVRRRQPDTTRSKGARPTCGSSRSRRTSP